jgi:hypothetical protein
MAIEDEGMTAYDGATAPDITLTAIRTGRRVRLSAPGRLTLVVCLDRKSAADAEALAIEVRRRFPSPEDLLICNVVDLHDVPRPLRKLAESTMKKAFERRASALPSEADPAEYVFILPDWKGEAGSALELTDRHLGPGIVVIGATGRIMGRFAGGDLLRDVTELIQNCCTEAR